MDEIITNDSYNKEEPDAKPIGIAIVAMIVFLILIFISCIYMYKAFLSDELRYKMNTDIPDERKKLIKYELEELNTLKRLNDNSGNIQIPVEKAKEIIIKRYRN